MITEFKHWIVENLQSQAGKTVVITGANSGIGFYTALALADVGAHVILAGRSEEKIEKAIEQIKNESVSGTIEPGIVDLARLASVRSFAESFKENHSQLDILINNAGVMMPPESKTEDGFELQFGVNFLSHFALTGMLYACKEGTDHGF